METIIFWIFGITFFLFFFKDLVKNMLFKRKISNLIKAELDEVINGNEFKVKDKYETKWIINKS